MTIQNELLKNLQFEYGEVAYRKKDTLFTYDISFDYTVAPSLLTIKYDSDSSKISIVMSYAEDFFALAKNDLKKTNQILKYLDFFHSEPTVSIENGNMLLSHSYSFEPETFDYKIFSKRVTTIEKMTHEVNYMLSTKDLKIEDYQDTIHGGGIFEWITPDYTD